MKNVIAVLVIALVTVTAFGQNKYETAKRVEQTDKQLAPVNAYVKAITDWVDEVEYPHMVITDVADYNDSGEPTWKKYDSQKAFEEANTETYTTAFIWKKRQKVVQVNFTYSSPSGDWVQYVFHTYYPNGQAARIDRELRTFMGDVIVNRVTYYNRKGKLLANTVSFRDLASQKPIKKPEDFMDMDGEMYVKVSDLPFATHLLEKKRIEGSH